MENKQDMLLTNTLSTPMVYYTSYSDTAEDIKVKYGEIKLGSADDLKGFFDAGVVALKNKNINVALSNFSKVIEMVPGFVPAVNNLGALYSSVGRVGESIYFFEEGIKKDPKNFQVRYNLGTLYCLNKNFQLAKDQLFQAKSLLPNDPSINNNLALSLLSLDARSQEGKDIFSKLTQENSTFDVAFHNYGYVLSSQGSYDESISYYKQALEKNKNSYVTRNDLACCLYRKGEYSDAVELLVNIIEDTEYSFQPAVYNLGYIVAKNSLIDFSKLKK